MTPRAENPTNNSVEARIVKFEDRLRNSEDIAALVRLTLNYDHSLFIQTAWLDFVRPRDGWRTNSIYEDTAVQQNGR